MNREACYDLNMHNRTCNLSQHQGNTNETELDFSICKNETLLTSENNQTITGVISVLSVIFIAIIVIGLIANILVLAFTIFDKTLHKPTFTSIGALSLADILCLFALLMTAIKNEDIMYIFSVSSLHVLLIALVRYIILVHPFLARNHLNCKKIIFASFLCFVLSICTAVAVMSFIGNFLYVFIISIIAYYVPFIMTAIFHAVKYYKMKKQARQFNRNVDQMGRVVVVIIVTSCILPLPRIIFNAYEHYSVSRGSNIEVILDLLFTLLMILNHLLNPFVYCFLSKSFRDSFRSVFCKCQCCR